MLIRTTVSPPNRRTVCAPDRHHARRTQRSDAVEAATDAGYDYAFAPSTRSRSLAGFTHFGSTTRSTRWRVSVVD